MRTMLVVALALCSSGAFAVPIMIDSFNYGNPNLSLTSTGSVNVVENALPEVLGGTRDSTLNVTTYVGGTVQLYTTLVGTLDLSTPPSDAADVVLFYNNSPTDWDLTGAGSNSLIQVVFVYTDQSTQLDIELNDGTNSWTQSQTAAAGGAQTLWFPLSGFTGVDTTSVDSITVTVSGPVSFDPRIDFISTDERVFVIPEPCTLALLGVGLLGLARRRRKS